LEGLKFAVGLKAGIQAEGRTHVAHVIDVANLAHRSPSPPEGAPPRNVLYFSHDDSR
jgi:hypothetical protein